MNNKITYLPKLGTQPFNVLEEALNSRLNDFPELMQNTLVSTLKEMRAAVLKFYSSEKYRPQVRNILDALRTLRRIVISAKLKDAKDILDEIEDLTKEHLAIKVGDERT